jgi:radical SAM superfamily enzyme YgiQ (UPF0313 family)
MEKIVFVQPYYHSVWDALGLAYIGSYVKANYDGDLKVDFYQCFFDSNDQVLNGSIDADIVGFSCTTPTLKHGLDLASKIKKLNPNVWTVFGGWGPSAQPKEIADYSQVDTVVVGEGEESMLKIVEGNRDKIIWSQPIRDLDSLPWPNRELIRVDRTIALTEKNDGERITSVQGGRGCPFSCVYCCEKVVSQHKIRRRNVSNLLDEIEFITNKYRLDLIKFVDPEVNPVRSWVKNFCREAIKRNLNVEFEANIHASFVDKEMFTLMKRAGFRQVDIGAETGSPRIMKDIRKGTTIELVRKAFHLAKKAGILRRAYFIVGMPNETREDVELTFKFAESLEADIYGMSILCPFPGCDLYSQSRFADVDWAIQDEYTNDFYNTKYFSNEELKEIQQRFVETFRDRLCYRLREKK